TPARRGIRSRSTVTLPRPATGTSRTSPALRPRPSMPTIRPAALALAAALALVCAPIGPAASAQPAAAPAIIPAPTSITRATGRFPIDTGTTIVTDAGAGAAVENVARVLAELLAPTVGAPRRLAAGAAAPRRSIHLTLAGADQSLG